ncbi:MAG: FtsQ-type POTRA domain-containing protein [Candidatus Peregrinibacteria bacterium]
MFNKKRNIKKLALRYGQSSINSKALSRRKSKRKLLHPQHQLVSKLKRMLIFMASTATILLTAYLLFFSAYFEIKHIQVGKSLTENETLDNEIANITKDKIGNSLPFLNTDEIRIKILEAFPEIEQVEINKDYPDTVIINFAEYPLVANVINESPSIKKSYIINSLGYAVKEDLENTGLPYIRIKSDEPINIENPVIGQPKLKYILDTITYFEDKFGMRIIEVQYEKIPREIHLLTEKNFYIWIDMQYTAEDQLKKLKKALVKLDIYNENLEYIDLRIAGEKGDKIIYKRR